MPIGAAGAVALGAGALSAGASIYGSSQAAGAAGKSADMQAKINNFNNLRDAPYVAGGNNALNRQAGQLDGFSSELAPFASNVTGAAPTARDLPTVPGMMTQQQLEQTPGYQFTREQGLQAVQNSAAARGLGVSGAALKGAATYATGLADSTYQDQFKNQQALFGNTQTVFGDKQTQFSNANTIFTNALNMNKQIFDQNNAAVTTGANVAVNAGSQNVTSGANQGSAVQKAGEFQAAGLTGVGNAFANGVNQYQEGNYLAGLQKTQQSSGSTYTDPINS